MTAGRRVGGVDRHRSSVQRDVGTVRRSGGITGCQSKCSPTTMKSPKQHAKSLMIHSTLLDEAIAIQARRGRHSGGRAIPAASEAASGSMQQSVGASQW